jgi:hypothetical protein
LGLILALGAGALLSSCSDQPKVRCATRGQYAAKYTLVTGTGDCAGLKGDMLGVATYNGSNADNTPNWDDATIGIQPYSLAALTNGAPPTMAGDSLFALGHFATAEPGDNSVCEVPVLSVAEVHVPAITDATTDPMTMVVTCPAPAQDVKYAWSNVRAVVSAAVLGTQFSADLTYTANGCTATYRVWAVSPPVSCAAPPPPPPPDDAGSDDATPAEADAGDDATLVAEAGGEAAASDAGTSGGGSSDASGAATDAEPQEGGLPPVCTMPPAATPAPMLDITLCSPFPDLSKNRPLGSGLNPDLFPGSITCDPDTTLCVLTRDPAP